MKIDADFEKNHFEVKEIHQLDRGTDFYAQQSFLDEHGRSDRAIHCGQLSNLQIFMVSTSVEIFVNEGSEVFTCRFYGMETEFLFEG